MSTLTHNASPLASNSLYVGDLHPDVSESKLFELFNNIGPVASVRVCRDVATRRSLGYAYVNFHTQEDATKALEQMNNILINARPCRIMWSQRDPSARKSGVGNIVIKKLDESIDHKTLHDTFSVFGNILSCKVALDEGGKSKGYGFVHFESEEAAKKAIDTTNDKQIGSSVVTVVPFIPRKERGNTATVQTFTNLHIKNLDEEVTTESLSAFFSKYGSISSARVMKDEHGKSKCFGFINFKTHDETLRALNDMNNKPMKEGGKNIIINRAQKKSERQAELRRRHEQIKQDRAQRFMGCNLYIKNLDEDTNDEKLKKNFESFGNITSAKVMIDEKGISKCFGFVCFTTPEEASKAQEQMHQSKSFTSKPLYVAFAQRKEQRRLQLETFYGRRPKNPNMPIYPPIYPPFAPQQHFMYPVVTPGTRRVPSSGYAYSTPNTNYPMHSNTQGSARIRQQRYPPHSGKGKHSPSALQTKFNETPVAEQQNVVGEALYPLVEQQCRNQSIAGKITGMLLERYSSSYIELINLMETPAELEKKIREAQDVLRNHGQK